MQPKHAVVLIALLALAGVIITSRPRRASPEPAPTLQSPAQAGARLKLPTPRVGFQTPAAGESAAANAVARALQRLQGEGGDSANLDAGQVELFLTQRGRNAESLLAAAQATGDKAYLREAMAQFPTDPRVAFAAYYLSGPYDNQQPASAERRQWLATLKQSAPDNALPYYLAARDDFRAGRTDEAVQELLAADGKCIEDYALELIQNREEAYRAAGWPEAEAAATAASEQLLPQLAELKHLGLNLTDLAAAYRQAGDPASADAAVALALRLGEELERSGPFLINDLVAAAIEANALRAMDPNAVLGSEGQTAQTRLDTLQQRRDELKAIGQQVERLLPTLPDLEVVNYFDRVKLLGEYPASQWLLKTYTSP